MASDESWEKMNKVLEPVGATNAAAGIATLGTTYAALGSLGYLHGKCEGKGMTNWEMEDKMAEYGVENADELGITDIATHPFASGKIKAYQNIMDSKIETYDQ